MLVATGTRYYRNNLAGKIGLTVECGSKRKTFLKYQYRYVGTCTDLNSNLFLIYCTCVAIPVSCFAYRYRMKQFF